VVIGAALDRRATRNGIGPRVALIGIGEAHGKLGLRGTDDVEGDAAGARSIAKVSVKRCIRTDGRDVRGRVGIDRECGYRGVPDVVGGQDGTSRSSGDSVSTCE
jgi:hypothetical protein